MEIEMMKSQLKEYHWIKEENNNEKKPFGRKARRKIKRTYTKNPYCKSCRKFFKTYTVLIAHKRMCPAKKESCKQEEETPTEADEDEENKENDRFEVRPLVSCKDCKRCFPTTKEIFEHRQFLDCMPVDKDEETDLSDNTDDEYEYDKLYTCSVCRAKFISADLLKRHRLREGHCSWDKLLRSNGVRSKNGFIVVKEEIEDFTFRSQDENEYSCTTCNNSVTYYDPDDLLKHHRAVHASSEVYCRYCSQKLSSIADFSDHHRIYHELQEHCRICRDKDYEQLDKRALPPKPICLNCCRKFRLPFEDCLSLLKENLYCDDCERVMPTVAHVKFHNCDKVKQRHMPLALLVCPLCMEMFNGLRSLYRHIIEHSDIMSYVCETCGRLHETWKALREHSRKCHSSVIARLPKVNEAELRKNAEDIIRRFVKGGVTLLA